MGCVGVQLGNDLSAQVAVPVRGMGCVGFPFVLLHKLPVAVPVRGMGCVIDQIVGVVLQGLLLSP